MTIPNTQALIEKIQTLPPDRLLERLKAFGPSWLAYDMKLMMRRYQEDGAIATAQDVGRLAGLRGHPPRSYCDFATTASTEWTQH